MGKHADDLPGGHYIVPFSQAVKFHGHICPGLAIGYYASHLAMRWLSQQKSSDNEIVALLESSGCAADAVQSITGCTIGKGNLIIQDNGKQVFTFSVRGRTEALRLALRPEFMYDRLDPELPDLREKVSAGKASVDECRDLQLRIERVCHVIMESPGDSVFDVRETTIELPERNGMPAMVLCSKCGEPVATDRAKKAGTGHVCATCSSTR